METVQQTKRRLAWSALLPIIGIILISTFFARRVSELLNLSRWVTHSEEVHAQIEEQQKLMVDMETGVRGYLLTGDDVFLEPFKAARNLQKKQLEALGRLIADNSLQVKRTQTLGVLTSQWIERAESDLAHYYRQKSFEKNDLRDRKKLMDEIRSVINEMVNEEERLIKNRRNEIESRIRASVRFAILGIIALGFGLAFYGTKLITLVSRNYEVILNERNQANERLAEANASLETRVNERTRDLLLSQETLKSTNLQLDATNKELEAFCYSVSHDLRTPLRGIDGFSQALLEDYEKVLDATGKRYLGFIRQGIQKMGRLIDDLLDLSRLTRAELKHERVNLSKDATQIAKQLNSENPMKQVDFKADENLVVEGDSGLLKVALQNLLSNAWKFSAKSVQPTVRLGTIEREGKRVYYVKDNGAGFDMTYYGKLFGAFQRLHSPSDFQGTGIGLATVKRVIYRHGGSIWAESKPGEGATFYFTL